jgi:nicotinamidase-related amidase
MPDEGAGVLRNARILLETAQEFGLPVAVSEQYPKGLGPTAAELRAALPADCPPFEKVVFSCCGAPGFDAVLERLGDRDIILGGIETHVCVLQTALDLLAAGRRVFVAADATASRASLNWKTGLRLMRQAGAVIGTTEIFVFSLLGAAGTEQFRRISKLVK